MGGEARSSRGSAEVLRPMAMRRRWGPPSFSRPEAAISAVAFKACDKDISMLLCPAHSQTSPKRTSFERDGAAAAGNGDGVRAPGLLRREAGNPFPHRVDYRGGAGSSGPVQGQGDEGSGRPLSVEASGERGVLQDHVRAGVWARRSVSVAAAAAEGGGVEGEARTTVTSGASTWEWGSGASAVSPTVAGRRMKRRWSRR